MSHSDENLMNNLKCPRCGGSEARASGWKIYAHNRRVHRYRCKSCGCSFADEYRRTPVDVTGVSCPRCGNSKVIGIGVDTKADGSRVQRYRCKSCEKSFISKYCRTPAQPAENECPLCGSSNTVKVGKPVEVSYGTVQPCKCQDCGKSFRLGGRKFLRVYLKGKEIYSCWNPPGLQPVPGVACPACGLELAVSQTGLKNEPEKGRHLVCFGCGCRFTQGAKWHNGVRRYIKEAVPHRSWRFEDDTWDLRELYPNIEEHRFKQLFLDFNNCGSSWFKKLVKGYILWRIQAGFGHASSCNQVTLLDRFGRFLREQGVTLMEGVNRLLLATYWTAERGHLSRNTLNNEMGGSKVFLDWGNTEQHFTTPPTLITTFDMPKVFFDEPDPLEDHVLDAIRDNLYVLPQPLHLMFILGFWLGTRPSELCYLRKDCLKIDPDGSTWWVEFERRKTSDEHRLPITTDLVHLIQQQQNYITKLHGEDYPYLFCHYQGFKKSDYPEYLQLKALKCPPISTASVNSMVKAICYLIERCNIRDSNGRLVTFTGAILRPSRATQLIRDGFSLEFIRIWLLHHKALTTKRYYTRYRPGELLDVACVMANLDGKFISYDSNPESLRQNPELHKLDGLKMPTGEPLYGYCMFREFCPRFGRCYTCGFHVASADKLPHYKAQLERLRAKKNEVFNYGSSEILESYTQIANALEDIVAALEKAVI